MSTELYAAVGRKQLELDALNAEYDRLLMALSAVANGAIAPADVSVDLKGRSWAIKQEAALVATSAPAEVASE